MFRALVVVIMLGGTVMKIDVGPFKTEAACYKAAERVSMVNMNTTRWLSVERSCVEINPKKKGTF